MNHKEQIRIRLKEQFGHQSFREGQEEAILAALNGKHTLVMLPTGTGKSICYQLTGYSLKGLVVIVSPLLSLMQDQVEQFKKNGEKRVVAVNSMLDGKEKRMILENLRRYKFIFVSPEMLQQDHVLERLRKLPLALLVIDEAHCISQWGMDFRLDYLGLGKVRKILGFPLTMALTATATQQVRNEILQSLLLEKTKTKQLIYSIDRKNIAFAAVTCKNDKNQQLIDQITQLEKPGIVYFSSRKKADQAAKMIRERTGISAESYHSEIDNEDKIKIQQQFIYDQIQVVCATSAFGMGINKSNIRFVVHYHLPGSPEAYLQEVGRCGRDGEPSLAVLLYEEGDGFLQAKLQESTLPTMDMLRAAYQNRKVAQDYGNPIQQQLMNYYLSLDVPFAEAEKQLTERSSQKQRQLIHMVQFAESNQCKRELLLHYFDETVSVKPEPCCSSCGLDIGHYQATEEISSKSAEGYSDWKNLLNKLFLLAE